MKLRKLYNRRQWIVLLVSFMIILSFGVITFISSPSVVYAEIGPDGKDDGEGSGGEGVSQSQFKGGGTTHGILNSDGGIYGAGSDPYRQTDTMKQTNYKKPNNKFYIEWIINIVRSPGEMIQGLLLEPNKMTMNDVVFGRLNKDTPINYYQFELAKGNPYGIVGAYLYNVFRLIMVIVLSCIFMGSVAKSLLLTYSVKARDELKASFMKIVFFTTAVFLMPYAFQIFNFVRDVILYPIKDLSSNIIDKNGFKAPNPILSEMAGVTDLSKGLHAIFHAISGDSILGAFLYDGFIVLSIYFSYSYVGVALAMTLYFVMFPFVCVTSYFDKSVASTWVKSVLSTLLVPIIDGTLLLIPCTMFVVLLDKNWFLASILTFMICAMIVPSRKVIGRVLGLDMGGIAALGGSAMAMMAVGKGLAGIGKALHGSKVHRDNAKAAKDQEKMEKEMDQAEKDVYGAGMENSEPMEDISVGAESGNGMGADAGVDGFSGASGGAGSSFGGASMDHSLDNAKMESGIATRGVGMAMHQGEYDKAKRIYNDPNASEARKEQARKDMGLHEKAMDSLRVNDAQARKSIAQNKQTDMAKQQELAMRQQKIMERYANVGMIGTPQFNNLSSATRAKLLRQYRRQENRKAIGGFVGGVYGAAVGMGSGMFMGAPVQAMMMGAGANIGASTGRAVANSRAVDVTSSAIRRAGSAGYTALHNFNGIGEKGYGRSVGTATRVAARGVNYARSDMDKIQQNMSNFVNNADDYVSKNQAKRHEQFDRSSDSWLV